MRIIAPILSFESLAAEIHADNVKAGWWTDLHTGQPLKRNTGELLMLCVSEVSEAHGGFSEGLYDDKLPHRAMFEVELADTVIRLFDIAGNRRIGLQARALTLLAGGEGLGGLVSTPRALLRIVDALSRAMEGDRKGDTEKFELGITEALLRVYEIADDMDLDVVGAIVEKREYNRTRSDHQVENRRAVGGKVY